MVLHGFASRYGVVKDVGQRKRANNTARLPGGILGSGLKLMFGRFVMQDNCSNCGGSWIEWEAETWTVDVTDFDRSAKVPLTGVQRRRCGRCQSVQVRAQYELSSPPTSWQWEKIYSPPEGRDKCRCCDGFFIEGDPVVVTCDDYWINIQHRRCNKCQSVDRREQLRPNWRWSDWTLHRSPPHVTKMLEDMKKQFHENREKYRVKSFETLCEQLSRTHIFRKGRER